MFKKPIEVMAKEFQYDPLPNEVRTVVIAAWTRGGLLPKAVVEQMIPAKTLAEIVDNQRDRAAERVGQ